jgi:hypothetical protein
VLQLCAWGCWVLGAGPPAPSAGLGVEVEAGKESLGFVAPDEAGEVLGEGGLGRQRVWMRPGC